MTKVHINALLRRGFRLRAASLTVTAVCLALSAPAAWSQSIIDPDADAILRSMTDQMKNLKEFSADYDTDHEVLEMNGEKLQFSASGKIAMSRAAGFRITRHGPYADTDTSFDGKMISLYGEGVKVYAQIESPGPTLDAAIEEFRISTGLDAPGADLLASDPYAVLTEGVVEGSVVGTGYVGGVQCDHLAFRNDEVDWQIWISKGEHHLPMKYVITTKWVTGSPQYTLRLSNWNMGKVDTKLFSFKPPAGAKKLDAVYSDAVGDLVLEVQE